MGWNNPPTSWREHERLLSGRPEPDGGDGPGHSRKRPKPELDENVRRPDGPVVPYAELHSHSNFSFLDGASGPDELVKEAISRGLHALALTDHDGFYGAPRFAEEAQLYSHLDLKTIYGAELSLDLSGPQNGVADPEGNHLLVLARGVGGYHRLAAAITDAQLRGDEKGRPVYDLEELAERGRGHWFILTGCRKGHVRGALATGGHGAAAVQLDRLTELFGIDNVAVELIDHGFPTDSAVNDVLAELAADHGLPTVATNNVHYARPEKRQLAAAMAAVRARRGLAEMDGWLPATGSAYVRSGAEMQRIFRRYPGAVGRSVGYADELAFDLRAAKPKLPGHRVPQGHTPMSYLRELAEKGIRERYRNNQDEARARIEDELAVIEEKDFPGYFLIVHDIVQFARSQGILCQGRGSSANSALCYALEITAIDSIKYNLPFARFLATTREEEPDIDVDFDSDRREEVIQWVYDTYGRHNAAQVANVISYRPRSAVRDAAKALGYSAGQQDAWSKEIDRWGAETPDDQGIPPQVVRIAGELMKAPRHLGIHSGGMILTERPIGEVCPIERGRMDKRTVLQWDKDACEWMGLVKFDLLGLGMLGALDHTFKIVAEHLGEEWDLDKIPKEEQAVYDMLCRADSIGVFQVESRAQIGTLPRLKPREFYDLAIEIALIRPGPIQGGAVHPYIRRATGKETVTYPHPVLEEVLKRTLGVPLFQEQLMQMAIKLGGCTADEADLLRRAMGSKRGIERIESLKDQLFAGMKGYGIDDAEATAIYLKIKAFSNFGFAESHALSFALLVYASSWLKLHYPGAFLAALLRNQPMGFYSPQSLTADARRHGVRILRPDILLSRAQADLEVLDVGGATGMDSCLIEIKPPKITKFIDGTPDPTPQHRRDGNYAVRLGLDEVQGIGKDVALRIVAERDRQPYKDMADVSRRAGLSVTQMESLATAGAFDVFGLSRRQAMWNAGYTESTDQLAGTAVASPPPTLPGMSEVEVTLADLWATRISPETHPIEHVRDLLRSEQILSVAEASEFEAGRRVKIAGLITHRQRPSTAGGVTFLNIEDETGMLNVVCSAGVWGRYRRVGRNAAGMIIRGMLERNEDGVTNLIAEKLMRIESVYPQVAGAIPRKHRSRDFQ